ncbi:MAG: ABC transporter substrate-binding protein [Alphaproteobacteria bacterium]
MSKILDTGLDRRTFLKASAATGVAASVAAPTAAKAAPSRGGTFRIGKAHGSTSDTLDPGIAENGFQLGMLFAMHNYLTKVASDGSVEPEIAESWEASPDASEWRFKIRSGVTFSNGKDVTPEDVVASMNHHRGEDSTSVQGPQMEPVEEISVDGDTVVFKLAGGNADFPFTVTDYHMPILPANSDGTANWQDGIGCGAYQLDHYEPGVGAELSHRADDWDAGNRGWFNEIQMTSIVDLNARTTALVSGDVDVIDRPDLKTVNLLARNPGVIINSAAGTQHYTFPMRTDQAPFNDNNVRMALKHAVNREEMVEKILFGYGSVGNDTPIGPANRYHNTEMEQTSYDPDKAKWYLEQAGLSNLTVDLSAADAAFAGALDAAVLYQNSAGPAGIDINVIREPNDGYWSDVWMNKGWCACYWGGRPVEDQAFAIAYQGGVPWNDTFWQNDRFDELLIMARSELDTDRRREMYYEMQVILNQEGGLVCPMFASYVWATRDNVMTPDDIASNWAMDGERSTTRWWFA